MMKSSNKGRTVNTHHYTLWCGDNERDDGAFIVDTIVISMGEHGSVHAQPANDRSENPVILEPRDRLNDLAVHNIAEMQRAREEGEKWETRMNDSPLGKTQQDFVAYYTDVVALFTEWCTAHGIPFPS